MSDSDDLRKTAALIVRLSVEVERRLSSHVADLRQGDVTVRGAYYVPGCICECEEILRDLHYNVVVDPYITLGYIQQMCRSRWERYAELYNSYWNEELRDVVEGRMDTVGWFNGRLDAILADLRERSVKE